MTKAGLVGRVKMPLGRCLSDVNLKKQRRPQAWSRSRRDPTPLLTQEERRRRVTRSCHTAAPPARLDSGSRILPASPRGPRFPEPTAPCPAPAPAGRPRRPAPRREPRAEASWVYLSDPAARGSPRSRRFPSPRGPVPPPLTWLHPPAVTILLLGPTRRSDAEAARGAPGAVVPPQNGGAPRPARRTTNPGNPRGAEAAYGRDRRIRHGAPLIGRPAGRGGAPPCRWGGLPAGMEGAVSNVEVCNLAYAGRLEELRAQLLRDRALATATDQVSRSNGQRRVRVSSGQPRGPGPADRRSLSTGPPHRAALGLFGGTYGRGGSPAGARRARRREGRREWGGPGQKFGYDFQPFLLFLKNLL